MTLHVQGRSTYREDVAPRIRIYRSIMGRKLYDAQLFELARGDLEKSEGPGIFRVVARHPEGATDIEEDSAYVFVLEGAGLTFDGTHASRVSFNAVATKLHCYPEGFRAEVGADLTSLNLTDDIDDEIGECDGKHCKSDPHLRMPFFPPEMKLPAMEIYVELDFRQGDEPASTLPVLTTRLQKNEDDD